jgi:6-phosphogluconolactonase
MPQSYFVYVGTFTNPRQGGKGEGVYVLRLNGATAALETVTMARGVLSPGFLAFSPDHKCLYAVNEVNEFNGKPGAALTSFAVDPAAGALTVLNEQAEPGPGPCYVSLDKTGRWALAANYQGGSVVVLPILSGGTLGAPTAFVQHNGSSANADRQEAAHAHSIIVDAGNRFALVADLGMDKIMVYRLDGEKGTLTPHNPPSIAIRPGAGPRHMTFHPAGRYLYVANELDSTARVIEWDGALGSGREVSHCGTLPPDYSGVSYPAEIQIAPSGRFVYVSNRGHDSIAILAVEDGGMTLRPAGHVSTQGEWPRHFGITPDGRILLAANEKSDTLVSFWIDQATGQLTPSGRIASVPTPVCVRFMAAT